MAYDFSLMVSWKFRDMNRKELVITRVSLVETKEMNGWSKVNL